MNNTGQEKAGHLKALQRLILLLSRRDHSLWELRQKLQKHFSCPEVEKALKMAQKEHWLRDEKEISLKWAEQMHADLKSHLYIEGQLRKRKLPLVEKESQREFEKAYSLIRKRKESWLSSKNLRPIALFLNHRGFDSETIEKILHTISSS